MLAYENLETEADVEFKVIWPLLTGSNYLEIPEMSIRAKSYLHTSQIDKAAGKNTGYYPDLSIWVKALPVLIVEAKAPEVAPEVGYREASLYARQLNQRYKTNLNPCRFIISCNGLAVLVGYWDSGPELDLKVSDILVGSSTLETLREFCHFRLLESHAIGSLRKIRSPRLVKPYTLVGDQPLINSKKPYNSFAADLAPILRRYFASSAKDISRDIYEKGYVGSDDITTYDAILESLLKDRVSNRRGSLDQPLEPTRTREPKLSAAIRTFKASRPATGQLQLITGGVGSGKSLFARRYKELLQPPEQAACTRWAFIDFNTAPSSLESAETWLCNKFTESFYEENPIFDPYASENLPRIFSVDLQRRKGIYDGLRKISESDAERARWEDFRSWQEDSKRLAFGICRHFSKERQELIVVVMDNVDRLELKDQLASFQMSLWFMEQSGAFIILQMRDETYERFKDQPPLDTYRSGVTFHITPPRFIDVVKRRLELSLDYLTRDAAETLEYRLSSGARIIYPKSMLGEFLKSIYLELFERRQNVSRVLQGIAGRDVRRALEMFVSILNSGHLSEEAITSTVRGSGEFKIHEHNVLKILMRTDRRFFSDTSGFVSNLFYCEDEWEQPNNFIIPDVLFWLYENRKKRGELGYEGYFSVARVADEMQLRGFVREDVLAACSWLVGKHLLEADHMNTSRVNFHDCIKVTASGFMHLRILCERMEYVYGVLSVTPIFDRITAERIADYLKRENQQDRLGPYQMIQCVELFLEYLRHQHARLSESYREFGRDRTGAAYIIKQVEQAVNYYRSPHGPNKRGEPNILDLLG